MNLDSLRPIKGKPGWYHWVEPQLPKELRGVPGIKIDMGIGGSKFLLHQTHLPVLPGAERYLTPIVTDAARWNARDARTKPLGYTLRRTQQQGIDFIKARRGTLLGDDMRLGKTLTAIESHDPHTGPLVVFAPLNTRGVWMGWFKRAFPGVPVGLLLGSTFKPEVLDKPIIFGHYDILKSWQAPFPIGTFVLDEAHLVGNAKTKRTQAALFHARNAQRVIAMTGTPIWNLPPNLWSILMAVAPGGWGTEHAFCWRYGLPEQTGYGTKYTGLSNEAELKARLSEVMLRRRWVDVADDVPEITRSVVVADVDQKTRNRLDVLAAKFKTERTNTAGNLAHYRAQLAEIKIPVVVKKVESVLDGGAPIVVWTWHKEVAEKIAAKLGERAFMIHGDIPPAKRDDIIGAWRAQPAAALVANMAVADVGLDFSHARRGIFAELDFIPARIAQAEMRTFDPTRGMDIEFVVADHFVDHRIVRALVAKLGAQNPLSVGAAIDAIDALREAIMGPQDDGDLSRLLDDFLAST